MKQPNPKRGNLRARKPLEPHTVRNAPSAAVRPNRTPLYAAFNAERYLRQNLIKAIEARTGRTLICYVASDEIDRNDVLFFVDLLHNIPAGTNIDLLLHTPGGDVDAAEKLIQLVRRKVTDQGEIRVIIPDRAKSAGTLMALGGNKIVMSDTSELGTIDPQYVIKDAQGNEIYHSVLDYLNAYDEFSGKLKKDPEDVSLQAMFSKFDPALLNKYRQVHSRARTFAENLMKRHSAKYTAVVDALMDTKIYPSHGQMIGWGDAIQIGLDVEFLPMDDTLWQEYWNLFCHYRVVLTGQTTKVFESAVASHVCS